MKAIWHQIVCKIKGHRPARDGSYLYCSRCYDHLGVNPDQSTWGRN